MFCVFFFFKQKTAYEISLGLVGSEMCIRDSWTTRVSNPHVPGYKAQYGVLLDMVGASGAMFFREYMSDYYASRVVDKVWNRAASRR